MIAAPGEGRNFDNFFILGKRSHICRWNAEYPLTIRTHSLQCSILLWNWIRMRWRTTVRCAVCQYMSNQWWLQQAGAADKMIIANDCVAVTANQLHRAVSSKQHTSNSYNSHAGLLSCCSLAFHRWCSLDIQSFHAISVSHTTGGPDPEPQCNIQCYICSTKQWGWGDCKDMNFIAIKDPRHQYKCLWFKLPATRREYHSV